MNDSKIGVEQDAVCNRDGCNGVIELSPRIECSCHIAAPCHYCADRYLVCSECGAEPHAD